MIDKYSHVPIYLQIEKILTEQIAKKVLSPGDAIPSETVLSEQYQVSRMTARKAVDYLVRQGIVERHRGRGTFVCEPTKELKMALPLDSHLTFSEVASCLGSPVKNKLLHLEKVPAPDSVCELLNIELETPVWYMKRLRLVGSVPFVFESSYMLADPLFCDLQPEDLNDSKYRYLENKGHRVKGSHKQIRAELPTEEVRLLLGLKREEPVLFAHSIASLENGRVFEVSDIYYNQEHYTFTLDAIR
jgi:DNA-binding GntR family transcriptional regulator